MEQEPFDLSQLFPNIAAQMRGAMANLRLAAAQLAPAAARETDPDLDARAALLDQSYYRLLRLVNDLTAAGCLGQEEPPLPLRDRDLTETARSLCDSARGLAELLGLRLEFRCARQQQICAFHRPSIEQLLFQLLSNAFRATPPGGTVTVELRPVRAAGAAVRDGHRLRHSRKSSSPICSTAFSAGRTPGTRSPTVWAWACPSASTSRSATAAP